MTAETLSYTQTTDVDARMVEHDIWGSVAHLLMLVSKDIIPEADGRQIAGALLALRREWQDGRFVLQPDLEDVHLNVEAEIIRRLSLEVGGKLHTARSRNDQVVTDSRLYVRDAVVELFDDLSALIAALLARADEQSAALTLGYTHSQAAQPVTFGFWLSSHASALLRDLRRLRHALSAVNLNPLGGCALAGTSFPIDREMTTSLLGFEETLSHAMDATSARDYMIETVSACAILMTQISRISEEIVTWSSHEYDILGVSDKFTTGSSIMPQKKNPVVAELARARTASVSGCLVEVMGVVKSVAMGYSCDLQQDKPPVWRALDLTATTVRIFAEQVRTLTFKQDKAEQRCWSSFSTATELANLIAVEGGKSFREAYQVTGNAVRELEASGETLQSVERVKAILGRSGVHLDAREIRERVEPRAVVMRQNSAGGTAPAEVLETIARLRSGVEAEHRALAPTRHRIEAARARTFSAAEHFSAGNLGAADALRLAATQGGSA